jgi:tetratricopeptide (TPR) repeat protein
MAPQDLIQQLLGLPDLETQKHFLEEHASSLDDGVASALKDQADHFLRADVQRSLQITELLFHQAKLTGNPFYRALGLRAEANIRCLGGLGEYQRAIDLYNEAAEIYRSHDCLVEQAKSQIGKLYALAFLGRYTEALQTGEWAGRVLEAHAEWLTLATLTMNLGLIHGRLGEDVESLALFDRARELYARLEERGESFLPWTDQNRAIALRALGQFEASIQASQRAMEMLTRLGQTAEAARARQNLAVTYFVLGRYNEALELLNQVREIFVADGRQRDAILVELFLSDCLLQLCRFTDVLDKCEQACQLFAKYGTSFEVGQATLNEAAAYAGLRRYDEALTSLAEARRRFEVENNAVWVACADLERAVVLYQRGQCEASLAAARACAAIFQASDLPVKEASAYLVAARAAAALGRGDEALGLVHEALAVGESADIPSLTYACHHLLGALAQARGELPTALTEYDRAIQQVERLRGQLMVEFRADFVVDKQVIYEDIVGVCLELGQPSRGLEYAERAKSRALVDLLAYRLDLGIRTRSEQERGLVEELMGLRAERDRLYRRLQTNDDFQMRGGGRQAQQEVLTLEKRITELWHTLLIRNADYARDASLWQVRAEPVQPYLSPETALLEYFAVRGRLIAFLVTAGSVQAHYLPGDLARLQSLLQLFWLNLKAVPASAAGQMPHLSANAKALLQRLHGQLIAPLSEALAAYPRLIVVPHGPLHYLPFHALYDGREFLLEQREISFLPGASLLHYCRQARPAASGSLVFGHSCDGRLPYTVQEARAVAGLLGEQVCLEDEASLARLRAAAEGYRVIHLATHGEFRPDNPLFSGLALADGWLTTLDIFNLHLRASLVTLSACQTGRSVVGGGDELLGLMRAFVYAGAASLVLSLWAVEDCSAARLMETFYRKLAAGWSKGAALRHAQRQFLDGQNVEQLGAAGPHMHPYFWASFCLVGDAGLL